MLSQNLQQKIQQKLAPQQILLMKLLQVPTTALEARIKEEMEVNPALDDVSEDNSQDDEQPEYTNEESAKDASNDEDYINDEFNISDYFGDDYKDDIRDYSVYTSNNNPDNDDKEAPLVSELSISDSLNEQLSMHGLSDRELKIGYHIIGSLDSSGYLERPIYAIVDDLAFAHNVQTTDEEVERILKEIQTLDPAGIGARNLQECLLLQLRRHSTTLAGQIAIKILETQFDEFTKKHYEKITKKLKITDAQLKAAIAEVLKLDPKPANSIGGTYKMNPYIEPDFTINVEGGELILTLNQKNMPELHVSRSYIGMIAEFSANVNNEPHKREALDFVKQKVMSAKWFIDAIKKRGNTLFNTMNAIMEYQREYFLTGNEAMLKPMILKDISDIVDLDISTISRVANSKYVQTPYGIFLLKSFFSESMSTDGGEEVSTREIKKILQDLISNEDKGNPLTDEELMETLHSRGYNIARRTVAKYREHLGIQVARLRKIL